MRTRLIGEMAELLIKSMDWEKEYESYKKEIIKEERIRWGMMNAVEFYDQGWNDFTTGEAF